MPVSASTACPLCGLRFANRPLLELHIREDHPGRPRPSPSGGASPSADDSTGGPETSPLGTLRAAAPARDRISARTRSAILGLEARIKQRLSHTSDGKRPAGHTRGEP